MDYPASTLIPKVRDLVSDASEPYRWEDSTMLDWLNEGVAAMFEAHPEFFYTSSVVVDPPDLLVAVDVDISTTQTGQKVLINYVAYRCLLRDNEDSETLQQATKFLELYAMGV